MNDPIPYHIREADIDEVLNAYGAPAEVRAAARQHVLQQVQDIDEIVRTAPETEGDQQSIHRDVLGAADDRPGDRSSDRRELALAAIEDVLITEGYVEPENPEARLYPITRAEDG